MLDERGAARRMRERARMAGAGAQRRAATVGRSGQLQISGYPAPKPSRPQLSFLDAGATVVSV
ncbi:hypothetical protein [Burkholderia sp. SIMBA_062]|uniref:hypothetical protein n=1 Tax=Burkholderia sp. SIMBA_062 TaxID=3085803 RepID=UPI00397BDB6E